MAINLLVLYEIAEKASKVKSKRAFKQFERWVKEIVQTYQDAAIERVAKIHLFQLEQRYSV